MQYWTRGGGAQTRAAVRWGSHSEEDFAYLEFSCFTYYFFIYSFFSELSTMTFRVIFTCQSLVQKSYPLWPRVWPGSAGRCVWKSIRSLLPRLSTVLREISQSPEKERRHDHLLVLSQLRINQDTMINGLYASMSAITDGRIFVDNFMSI